MPRVAMKVYPFGDQLLIKEVQEEFIALNDAVVCEKLCEIVEKEGEDSYFFALQDPLITENFEVRENSESINFLEFPSALTS